MGISKEEIKKIKRDIDTKISQHKKDVEGLESKLSEDIDGCLGSKLIDILEFQMKAEDKDKLSVKDFEDLRIFKFIYRASDDYGYVIEASKYIQNSKIELFLEGVKFSKMKKVN